MNTGEEISVFSKDVLEKKKKMDVLGVPFGRAKRTSNFCIDGHLSTIFSTGNFCHRNS